jgi:hypothetical protein
MIERVPAVALARDVVVSKVVAGMRRVCRYVWREPDAL